MDDRAAAPSVAGPSRSEWLLIAGSVAVALGFAAYTHHGWEDFYITYRSSKNLALGHGLVFQPGERIHGYTSPIGVLLPALLSVLTGNSSDDLVLWLFRLASAAMVLGTGLALVRAHRILGVAAAATALTLALAGLETKLVDFAMNGQEAAFLVFFLCASWACLVRGPELAIVPLALIWAGLQYTRPDGFIYGGCLAFAMLVVACPGGVRGRLAMLRRLALAAAGAGLLYLPWVIGCTAYYGSVIPHTIIAKSAYAAPPHDLASLATGLLTFPLNVLARAGRSSIPLAFAPSYVTFGGWPAMMVGLAEQLGVVAGLYWLLPFAGAQARAVSLAFALGHFYQSYVINPAPWYLPATTIFGVMTLGLIAADLVRWRAVLEEKGLASPARQLSRASRLVAAGVVLLVATILLCSAYQLRIYQTWIEDHGRQQIGRWLREHAAAHDTVFLEPLGYIGFHSGLKMLDFPGLVSEEVVAARRELHSTTWDWDRLIPRLEPTWLVMRPAEMDQVLRKWSSFPEQYEMAAAFDVSRSLKDYSWIPGRGYLEFDQIFFVFHRRGAPASAAR